MCVKIVEMAFFPIQFPVPIGEFCDINGAFFSLWRWRVSYYAWKILIHFFTLGGDHSNLFWDGPIWTSLKIFVSVFHSLSSSSTLSLLILSPCPQSLSPFSAQLSRPNPSRLRQSKAFLPSATFSRWLILIILESNRPSKSFCNSALYYAAR